ncbi:alkaline serine protease-like protein [Leptotrombidium deliense]|uniref:Alkaline serine protease-like protein n=1 Tax=Leptotrombidium deliense TaxID=299467 RepID=A0A443RXL4_9ACAR|nr:alkaline serine protease-like protein [Leptotrombidium deliense]
MIAPGSNCKVAKANSKEYTTMSGTSFSAPYVAGVAAMYYAENLSLTPGQLAQKLIDTAKNSKIKGLFGIPISHTPNRRIYKACDA